MKEKKVNIAPIDYATVNRLSEHFMKHFVPQKQLFTEQAFWLPISEIPPVQPEPVLKEISHELPTINLVKDSFNKMRSHVNDFENVVTVYTKVTGQNEERKTFKIKEKELIIKNDRLLENIICQDVMSVVMHANVVSKNVLPANNNLEAKLLKMENDRLFELFIFQDLVHIGMNSLAEIVDYQNMEKSYLDEYTDMVDKAVYNELLKRCDRMENRCILLKLKEAQVDYLKHTQKTDDTLREIVKQAQELRPLDSDLDSACKFTIRIQELLVYVSATCPSSVKYSEKLIAVTPKNKNKKVRSFNSSFVISSGSQSYAWSSPSLVFDLLLDPTFVMSLSFPDFLLLGCVCLTEVVDMEFLAGTSLVEMILVNGHVFPSIMKFRPVACWSSRYDVLILFPLWSLMSTVTDTLLVPSCFVIFDLEPLSFSFDFVISSKIFKSLSFNLDRPCHLTILCLDQHAHTLHHLESLLTISLDRLDILKEDLVYQSMRKSLSLILELS
nr:hypothetical protein [Tanacetum cinerariifolium]